MGIGDGFQAECHDPPLIYLDLEVEQALALPGSGQLRLGPMRFAVMGNRELKLPGLGTIGSDNREMGSQCYRFLFCQRFFDLRFQRLLDLARFFACRRFRYFRFLHFFDLYLRFFHLRLDFFHLRLEPDDLVYDL